MNDGMNGPQAKVITDKVITETHLAEQKRFWYNAFTRLIVVQILRPFRKRCN
jgi:hypothetical protein